MLMNPTTRRLGLLVAVLFAGALPGLAFAQDAGDAVSATERQRQSDAASQRKVDQLDDAARQALQEYRSAVWETQQLDVYADQLQTLVDRQATELDSLNAQLREVALTEREIMPLMLRMVDALERFIALDLPFLVEERRERVGKLRNLLGDPSESVADRYQQILEAYSVESDYGRGIGHERKQIDGRVHDVLRIGRVALYALSLDGSSALRWDRADEAWQAMPDHYARTVRQALRVSRETIAPELFLLPVRAPEPSSADDIPMLAPAAGDSDVDPAEGDGTEEQGGAQ